MKPAELQAKRDARKAQLPGNVNARRAAIKALLGTKAHIGPPARKGKP